MPKLPSKIAIMFDSVPFLKGSAFPRWIIFSWPELIDHPCSSHCLVLDNYNIASIFLIITSIFNSFLTLDLIILGPVFQKFCFPQTLQKTEYMMCGSSLGTLKLGTKYLILEWFTQDLYKFRGHFGLSFLEI